MGKNLSCLHNLVSDWVRMTTLGIKHWAYMVLGFKGVGRYIHQPTLEVTSTATGPLLGLEHYVVYPIRWLDQWSPHCFASCRHVISLIIFLSDISFFLHNVELSRSHLSFVLRRLNRVDSSCNYLLEHLSQHKVPRITWIQGIMYHSVVAFGVPFSVDSAFTSRYRRFWNTC